MPDIRVGHSAVARVDDQDYEALAARHWYLKPNGYAMATFPKPEGGREYRTMHRVILDVPRGIQVDHINRDRLDNRRTNLRISDQSQNLANQVSRRGTSVFKGVYWTAAQKGWAATIRHDGRTIPLGVFDSEIEAAFAYDAAAAEHFGNFARLNFPPNSAVVARLAAIKQLKRVG